jgi:hypothetical protein
MQTLLDQVGAPKWLSDNNLPGQSEVLTRTNVVTGWTQILADDVYLQEWYGLRVGYSSCTNKLQSTRVLFLLFYMLYIEQHQSLRYFHPRVPLRFRDASFATCLTVNLNVWHKPTPTLQHSQQSTVPTRYTSIQRETQGFFY